MEQKPSTDTDGLDAVMDNREDPVFRDMMHHTMRYHGALEEQLDRFGRERFRFHGDKIPLVTVIKASDGYLTFYQPSAPPDVDVQDGYHGLDYSEHDLNKVCQSLSLRYMRVAPPRIGEEAGYFPKTPDSDLISPGQCPFFTDPVIEALKTNQINSLPVMDIGPVVHIEQGVRKHITPGRVSIWSPVIDLPAGPARLYLWTHAELWWKPEALGLDSTNVSALAHREVLALSTMMGAMAHLSPSVAQNDIGVAAATELRRKCEELSKLLDEHGNDEESLHQWLKRDGNELFLDLDAKKVWSKVEFGNYVSNFVVQRSDGTYKLIEIEPAAERIFTASRSIPTHRFNGAVQQVRDWRRMVREQQSYFEKVTGLIGIYEPGGMVVMGRSADIGAGDAADRWNALKNDGEIEVATYDDLLARVRNLASQLENLLGSATK